MVSSTIFALQSADICFLGTNGLLAKSADCTSYTFLIAELSVSILLFNLYMFLQDVTKD